MHRRRPARQILARWTTAALIAGCAGALTTGVSTAAASTDEVARSSGPVVLIGTGGLRWADVSATATPALWSLLDGGASGDVTVRSVRLTTCPVDGWLTMSAGRRAADAEVPGADSQAPPCREPAVEPAEGASTPGGPQGTTRATVRDWDRYTRAAREANFNAQPGLLGDTLAAAGVCSTAVGPEAAVMLAESDGTVAAYRPAVEPGSQVDALLADPTCPLTVLDAGLVPDPSGASADARHRRIAAVDALVGQVLADVPPTARVLVVSAADDPSPRLQLLAAHGPGFGPGWLRTSSTRQNGLVQLTDLTPTLLGLLDVPAPTAVSGSPITVLSTARGEAPATAAGRLQRLLDLDQASWAVHPLTPRFFTALVLLQLLTFGASALVLHTRRPSPRLASRVRDLTRRAALVFAAVPVATYLANTAPWWRTEHRMTTLTLVVAGYTAVISAIAQGGPWRRHPFGPFGAVAGISAAVMAVDAVTGSRLQLSSLLGVQPAVAGRFYGFSNVAFALFASGALLFAIAVADRAVSVGRRRAGAFAVAGIGLVATVIDVLPSWGSDFGGPVGLVPAFALLTLLVLGVRITWARVVCIGVATVAFLAAVSIADWLRPVADQTHLGRFVQTVIDGGAGQVVQRKLAQNAELLTRNALSLLIPVGAALAAVTVLRPSAVRARSLERAYRASPTLRLGLRCLLLLVALGFAANDTGTVIPVVSSLIVVPLVIARCLSGPRADSGSPPPAR